MIYVPEKQKTARYAAFLSIIAGFVIMTISYGISYQMFFQVVALTLVIIGVFLLVRYVLSEFRYIIDDRDDGTCDFLVFKKQGKNDVKVCHISLSSVEDVYRFGAKKVKSDTRFGYNQNITDDKYVLLVEDGSKRTEVIIEPDEIFLREIKKRIGGPVVGNTNFMMN